LLRFSRQSLRLSEKDGAPRKITRRGLALKGRC
jgi:hypothetical protein